MLCFQMASSVHFRSRHAQQFVIRCKKCDLPLLCFYYSVQIDLRWPKLIHESGHAILRIIHDGIFSYDKFRVRIFGSL